MFRVVGIGEVLWDVLPGERRLGGAPANFASQARRLGARAALVSAVGNDDLGREAVEDLARLGVETSGIVIDEAHPTGRVAVELSAIGEPRFAIGDTAAWDFIRITPRTLGLVSRADALCYGTLAHRAAPSRQAIRALLGAARQGALRVCDLNIRDPYFDTAVVPDLLDVSDVLKVNEPELERLNRMLELGSTERDRLRNLAERFELSLIAVTRGARGSRLYAKGQVDDCPGRDVPCVNSVGAGDAFTAALTLGILEGLSLQHINARANEVASGVCALGTASP